MVTEDEIRRVADLMKIEISDGAEYVGRVKKMVAYFDILDEAGIEDEEISGPETPVSMLREDEHVPHPERLIEKIHNYKGAFVRAPKMI